MTTIAKTTQRLIEQIGATDQQSQIESTAELSMNRAKLRIQLSQYSQQLDEKRFFYQQAISLLEQSMIENQDQDDAVFHHQLSMLMAETYFDYYELTKNKPFLAISQQILKPIMSDQNPKAVWLLTKIYAYEQKPALTQHWLTKYLALSNHDLAVIYEEAAFKAHLDSDWLKNILKHKCQ